jgi:hypothetical protein
MLREGGTRLTSNTHALFYDGQVAVAALPAGRSMGDVPNPSMRTADNNFSSLQGRTPRRGSIRRQAPRTPKVSRSGIYLDSKPLREYLKKTGFFRLAHRKRKEMESSVASTSACGLPHFLSYPVASTPVSSR